jgi:tetratricopeptide (TPR) repeat protein
MPVRARIARDDHPNRKGTPLRSRILQQGDCLRKEDLRPGLPRGPRNASTHFRLIRACAVLIVLLLVWPAIDLFGATVTVPENDWEATFFKANQAYKEDRYQEAEAGYQKLLDAGYQSGHLYYNLGNAYLRQGELGPAILSYERARTLMPRDADLLFNLRYALDRKQDVVPEDRSMLATAFFWLDSLTVRELFWTFAVLNVLFWVVLLLRLFNRSDLAYYLLLTVAILWAIGGLSFGLKWYQAETDDRAVVLPKEVSIFSGPDERETVLFKLHCGTIVHQERSEDGWALVSFSGDKRGWAKSGGIERIWRNG